MKARIAAVLFGFVASGCVASAGTSGGYVSTQPVVATTTVTTSEPAYVEEPDLVEINGGVRVEDIEDLTMRRIRQMDEIRTSERVAERSRRS